LVSRVENGERAVGSLFYKLKLVGTFASSTLEEVEKIK